MKQFLSFLLLLTCYNCLLAVTVTVDGVKWTYTVSNGEATLSGSSSSSPTVPASTTGAITIPSSFGSFPVTRIGREAFWCCSGLTSVTIPESVTIIEAYAFSGCSGLTSITIPESVASIESYAFSGCYSLNSVVIPDSVTKIGKGAFNGCTRLISISIGVNNSAYSSIEGLILSKDCQTLVAASGGLMNVAIPESVKNIAEAAFLGCGKLKSVMIPNSVTNIGDSAFQGCGSLSNITIPKSITRIGFRTFCGCGEMQSIIIPDSVTNIGNEAFYSCGKLTTITIPDSVTNIGNEVFRYCGKLTSVTIPQIVCSSRMSYVFPSSYQSITNVAISGGVTNISAAVFSGCNEAIFDTTTIPNVKQVDGWVVGNTITAFTDLDLTGIRGIGNSAFSNCSELKSVVIPDSVAYIGSSSFENCVELSDIVMGNSVKRIGDMTFANCRNLTNVMIPESVTSIGFRAFAFCEGLKSINIPNYITKIEKQVFNGCCSMTSVTIPSAVTNIDKYAFYNCSSLARIIMKGNCPTIEDDAFSGINPQCEMMLPVGNNTYAVVDGMWYTVRDGEWKGMKVGYYGTAVVTFDANGGKGGWARQFDYGSVIVPPSVSRAGYTFIGWSPSVPTTVPAQDVTYTARWKINQYTVSFDANGGTGGKTVTQNYDTALTAPTVTRTGYAFMGWSPSVPSTVPAANVTYTARWKINQYTVSFDSAGGTTVSPITQDYATAITPPEIPTREGYTFMGWTPSVLSTMPAANTTCVAQWKINQYTISFDSAGGTSVPPITQDYATVITPPVNPTKTGYTFIGWTPSVPATMPTDNTTCVAQWQVNQHRVTFDAQGGDGGWTRHLDYGTAIDVPEVFRQGCTFEGWLPTPNSTVPDHDVVYTAQWKIWDVSISSTDKTVRELYPNDYQHITNIVIEASVVALPDNFFDDCDSLEKVTFLSPDTELGNNDLRKVGKLFANQPDGYWVVQGVLLGYKGVCPREIPNLDAVKRVFDGALEDCTALEELTFTAESVLAAIGTNAFKHCTELRQMTLPPSLIEIGNEAFMGCSYLGNVIVPGSVKKVGDRAFKNCTGFTAAQIEYGVESLGEEAFCGDWRISEVDIPSTVTNIGVNAFGGDSSIIRIGLRGDVRKASDIFSNYKFIREATVKEGTGEIVDGLFGGFEKLRDVRFFGNCPALENDGQLLYAMTPGKSDDNAGLTTFVEANSTGWDGTPGSHSLPQAWPLGAAHAAP